VAGHEVEHSSSSSAKVKNESAMPPLPLYAFMTFCNLSNRDLHINRQLG
jgi:hypothetical protein